MALLAAAPGSLAILGAAWAWHGMQAVVCQAGPRREDACALSRAWIKGEWFWVFFQRFQTKRVKMFTRVLLIFFLPTQANVWARTAGFSLLYFIWFQW